MQVQRIVTPPSVGEQSERVCLCVGLFVNSHISGAAHLNFTKFFAHLACGHSLVLLRQLCYMLCTSSFVENMFSHNGALWCR